MRPRLILLLALVTSLVALHVPYLRLPFHWDELGQFVPASLDLYRNGSWVTTSAAPNIHPPGVMALLVAVWSVTGYSILATRIAMLALAGVGVYLSFLLGIRLARGTSGAPAFAAVAFLVAAPMFYTQSMMVLLDMPAMVFTVAALLLFLDQRYALCAAVATILVLTKETAITTPAVFTAWLWFKDGRRREALYFLAPAIALLGWLLILKQATGSWFGNAEFARYNVNESLTPLHILYAIGRRVYTLFIADGHWIGTMALWSGWRLLRSRDWFIALWVAAAQIAAVTILGGAVLDRYLLPVLPVLYAAFAVAASTYTPRKRLISHLALLVLLVAGWFVNPPYPFPMENNLAVVDFVQLQKEAAQYVESNFRGRRVASAWPFTAAIRQPDLGYVQERIRTVRAPGLHASDIANLQLTDSDVVVLYSRGQTPPTYVLELAPIRNAFGAFIDLQPEASSVEMARLGYESVARWSRRGQWIEIYAKP